MKKILQGVGEGIFVNESQLRCVKSRVPFMNYEGIQFVDYSKV